MITQFKKYINEGKKDLEKQIFKLEKELAKKKEQLAKMKEDLEKENKTKLSRKDYYARKKRITELETDIEEREKLKTEPQIDSRNVRYYRGFRIERDLSKEAGMENYWKINIYHREFANKLIKGMTGVSITHAKELIDKYFELNKKIEEFKK